MKLQYEPKIKNKLIIFNSLQTCNWPFIIPAKFFILSHVKCWLYMLSKTLIKNNPNMLQFAQKNGFLKMPSSNLFTLYNKFFANKNYI